MTVIVSSICGGKISIAIDRRVSQGVGTAVNVVDDESNKLLVVRCRGALFAIVYTGVAVADQSWMDCVIANCLAHRQLEAGLAQTGAAHLARPAHALIDELRLNLNGVLNTDKGARNEGILVLVQGWEIRRNYLAPFSYKLTRGEPEPDGYRYVTLSHQAVGKFFRRRPRGLWAETLGDSGGAIDRSVRSLELVCGFTHDDIERHISRGIFERSKETPTVSASSVAVQLDPRIRDGQITFTYYPRGDVIEGHPILSPWVMTPRLISSSSMSTSAFAKESECGKYLLGGFSDVNTGTHLVARLPTENGVKTQDGPIRFSVQDRNKTPS